MNCRTVINKDERYINKYRRYQISVYGLMFVTGILVGIVRNTILNHKTIKNERKTDIEVY